MRKRTEKEKEAMGRIIPVLESLRIKKSTRGYVPLLDLISYAAAYPEIELKMVIQDLQKDNTYIGVNVTDKNSENQILPSMVRTIETAIERSNEEKLQELGMPKNVIKNILAANSDNQLELLEVLGEKYEKYSHEERIVFFFVKKILKSLKY